MKLFKYCTGLLEHLDIAGATTKLAELTLPCGNLGGEVLKLPRAAQPALGATPVDQALLIEGELGRGANRKSPEWRRPLEKGYGLIPQLLPEALVRIEL